MESREALLKRLSRKENIIELIKKYGNDPKKESLDLYQKNVDEVWKNLNEAKECEDNSIRSLYQAIIMPFLEKVKKSLVKVTSVEMNTKAIENSIKEYLGVQVAILSDAVIKCSINNYGKRINLTEDMKRLEEKFIEELRKDRIMLWSIFKNFGFWTYSVFRFLTSTSSYLNEVFLNLESEYKEIKDHLFGQDIKINEIRLEAGDRHNNKFVLKFKTDNNDLFYKPRNDEIEVSLGKITKLIGKYSDEILDLQFPKSYCRDNHQWVKENKYISLKNREEEERYYYRMGEILALYYILDGNDLHFENIISSGEYPILIDTETIFSNRMMLKKRTDTDYMAKDSNNYGIVSIKDIGIIPHFIKIGDISIDISSINYIHNECENENRNLDNKINLVDKSKLHKACTFITSEQLEEKLISGFTTVYSVFEVHREKFIEELYDIVADLKVRFLKHPTNDYARIKKSMMKPICYFDYAYAFATSARLYGDGEKPEKIELCEQKDLFELNIPRFEIKVNERNVLWNDSEVIEDYFYESAWETVKGKINYLNEFDYLNQKTIIEMLFKSLRGLNLKEPIECFKDSEKGLKINKSEINKADYRKNLEKEYHSIINEVINSSHYNPINKEAFFIGYQLQGDKYQVLALPNNYYSGILGLISILCDDRKYASSQYLKDSVNTVIKLLNEKLNDMGDYVLTGAYDGLGMYLRFVREVYQVNLIEEKEYISLMKILLNKCKNAVPNDKKYDVLNGNAGLLMVLTAIYDSELFSTLKKYIKEVIEITVEAMVKKITSVKDECFFAVEGMTDIFFTGFGHGSAGIVTALYKGMLTVGKVDRILISKLLDTERKYYDKDLGVWYKDNKKNSSSWGWCHGIPGILLSRIELLNSGYQDEIIRQEIDELVDLSLEKGLGHNTTFCHGDIATISIIESAFDILDKDERFEKISQYKYRFINEILLKRNENKVRGMETVGLMDGLIGIAYFLKCASEEKSAINVLNIRNINNLNERMQKFAV